MALGRRNHQAQGEFWIAAQELPKSPGHVFYDKLNGLLREAGFDAWIEALCQPYYAKAGRPGIPPGTYFRMLIVGYFEGISSQRAIAWRCADSLSLREFLGIPRNEQAPDHSSLTIIRKRLPLDVHTSVFTWILKLAQEKGLVVGGSAAVDSTTIEANAAMKSIVRRDTGEDWRTYVTGLMRDAGEIGPAETPTVEQIKRFDKARKGKKVSNEDWISPADPDSRITKMKDGTTHLAYKAEHTVDLETELILAAEVYYGNEADTATLEDTVQIAQTNLIESGSDQRIKDVVADKGYHSAEVVTTFAKETSYRTYISEPKRPANKDRVWTDKPPEQKSAVYANRRRIRGDRGRRLQRLRSEKVERTFAHVCETGGARRTWIGGIEEVNKRYVISAMAHNIGCLMRALFGMGTPKGLQKGAEELESLVCSFYLALLAILSPLHRIWRFRRTNGNPRRTCPSDRRRPACRRGICQKCHFSTGC